MEGGEDAGQVEWKDDLENFTVPDGEELPQRIERLIRNNNRIDDRHDARKHILQYLRGDGKFDDFLANYEFALDYKMVDADGDDNDFIGTFNLKGG